MTQKQMLEAIPTIQKLVGTKLPIKSSYAIFKLAKEIENQKDFLVAEEKKLIEKYEGTIDEQGRITFKDQNNFKPFTEEYAELNDMEVDIKTTLPIVINMDYITDLNIAPADLLTLEGIVDFE
jgi:hypothetical protein